MTENAGTRLKNLQNAIDMADIDCLLISNPQSIAYYLGAELEPMERLWLLLVKRDGDHLLIANELLQFETEVPIQTITVTDNDDFLSLFENYDLFPPYGQVIGVDDIFPAGKLLPLMQHFERLPFLMAGGLIDRQRALKTPADMEKMRQASALNDQAMARLIDDILPYGPTEKEACQALKEIYIDLGVDGGFSFEPIVAYGANGADPHHLSDDTRPQIGDAIIIDIGCRHQGFCSDMTRTVYFGDISAANEKIYRICQEAQAKGIEMAKKPRVTFAQIDRACRRYIEKAGFGPQFIHRTGHFIGQEAHEKGDVSAANKNRLEVGHCFSIEPGIYLPKKTAVRIEDLLMVTDTGVEVINHYPKELLTITPKE